MVARVDVEILQLPLSGSCRMTVPCYGRDGGMVSLKEDWGQTGT